MDLNLKVQGSTPPRVMSLSFRLRREKCSCSGGKVHCFFAEDSVCLACFYRATTMQGLEIASRFCDGKLDCFSLSLAGPLFQGRCNLTFTFFQVLDPFLSRERPGVSNKGRRNLTSVPLPRSQRLYQCQLSLFLALSACERRFLFVADPFPKHAFERQLCQAHILCQARLAQSVDLMDFTLKDEGSTPPEVMSLSFLLAFACTERKRSCSGGKVHCFFARGSRWR